MEQEKMTNKIYARLNEDNIVVKLFSNVFETPLETDLMVEEGNEDYHAHVHLKYQLIDMNGDYNYKFEDDKMIELTDEEKAKLFPKVEPVVEPTLEEKVQSLEDDNANLLFDLADKDVRLNQLENDFADLLLNLGGINNELV